MFGVRTSEKAPFTLLIDSGDIQIRQYQDLLVSETIIEASYADSGSIGFNRLAGYIFGNNTKQQKMAMVTPVLQEQTGTKWVMLFVMPSNYTLSTLPQPLDPLVNIKQISGKKVAVLRYSGSLNKQMITEKVNVLMTWLKQNHYQLLSKARSAAYDPPWTIPLLRRNEVHTDVEWNLNFLFARNKSVLVIVESYRPLA